jgi:hypothetical protein
MPSRFTLAATAAMYGTMGDMLLGFDEIMHRGTHSYNACMLTDHHASRRQ